MSKYDRKLLYVDLSTRKVSISDLAERKARLFIGGRGLGAKILFDELEPKIDPFSPQNPCIFTVGPFTGIIPGCPKFAAVTKSPLTGIYGCSIAGSFFGPELKAAGYEGLVVKGKARAPVHIWITDNGVEIKDAKHLWGMTTDEVDRSIKKELGKNVRTVCIGPAGEKLVRFASAISDKRAAGRDGTGAVLGSKKLKAISVRGEKAIQAYDSYSLKQVVTEVLEALRTNPAMQNRRKYGTPELVDILNELGVFPTRNHSKEVFEGAEEINAETLVNKYVERNASCFTCPIACGKLTSVRAGPYKGAVTEGPEFETIWAFGANCENDSLESIIAADMLCDNIGLDTISTGSVIAFAMECCEKGLITKKDVGVELRFGDDKAIIEMIRKIGYREGFGDALAEGVMRLSQKINGSERFAMHVKGLELPGWGVRGAIGQGLAYATACRGGCHAKAVTVRAEISDKYDRYSPVGKAQLVIEQQDGRAILDSLVICNNGPNRALDLKTSSRLLSLISGWDINDDELMVAAERIINLERLINVREGMQRKDDTLPERLFKDPVPDGPTKGHYVGIDDFNVMLSDYYAMRGWDSEGVPTRRKLEALQISD